MLLITLILGVFSNNCGAIVSGINESAYAQLPALFALEAWDGCMARGGVYCLVDARLRPSSDLYNTLQEYSADTQQHFNHTVVHRGVCASHCGGGGNAGDVTAAAVRCVNASLWASHALQTAWSSVHSCQSAADDAAPDAAPDAADLVVAAACLLLLAANAIGTAYDLIFCNDDDKLGNAYLLSFSLRRSWRRLAGASGGAGGGGGARDTSRDSLQLFNGMRYFTLQCVCFSGLRRRGGGVVYSTMTMICVMFSHTTLIMSYSYVDNPLYIETAYSDPMKQLLFNGSLVTHTFFVMSAFLLAHNYLAALETRPASWALLPRGLALRWLRLTPAYAAALGLAATWQRRAARGPLAPLLLAREAAACRQWWWAHLLYVNNYIYADSQCAPQTWYLAADTQLFAVGLLLCVSTRSSRARAWALAALFAAAVAGVFAQTYYQDLDAVVIQAPERSYRELYAHDATFRLLYVRGHSNLPSYALGLAAGFLAHAGRRRGLTLAPYRRWRVVYWLLVPLAVLVILSGGAWYRAGGGGGAGGGAGPQRVGSPLTRSLYAALYKPVFQFIVVTFILGAVFKIESVYRGVVSWRGWAWPARASYCAFLLHTGVQRTLLAGARQPTHMDEYGIVMFLSATIFLSFGLGAILFLLVEAPSAALIKALTTPPPPPPRHKEASQL